MFRGPIDPLKGLSEKEIKAEEKERQKLEISRKEEWLMYFQALKILLPVVLLVCAAFFLILIFFSLKS